MGEKYPVILPTSTPNVWTFYMPQIWDMGPTALLPLRRKARWGFFSTWKIRRLRLGSNPRTWAPEARVLTPRPLKPLKDWTYQWTSITWHGISTQCLTHSQHSVSQFFKSCRGTFSSPCICSVRERTLWNIHEIFIRVSQSIRIRRVGCRAHATDLRNCWWTEKFYAREIHVRTMHNTERF
jgi:hypothetical protein